MNLLVQDVIHDTLVKPFHFSTRIKENTLTDRNSHVFKHLNDSTNCKNHHTPNCFKILDSAKTIYTVKLNEAIYIQNRKPELKHKFNSSKVVVPINSLPPIQCCYLKLYSTLIWRVGCYNIMIKTVGFCAAYSNITDTVGHLLWNTCNKTYSIFLIQKIHLIRAV